MYTGFGRYKIHFWTHETKKSHQTEYEYSTKTYQLFKHPLLNFTKVKIFCLSTFSWFG